jgi:hypothetical protein
MATRQDRVHGYQLSRKLKSNALACIRDFMFPPVPFSMVLPGCVVHKTVLLRGGACNLHAKLPYRLLDDLHNGCCRSVCQSVHGGVACSLLHQLLCLCLASPALPIQSAAGDAVKHHKPHAQTLFP